ncbi:MAG: transposase [Acidobacteriota bacterium]
MSLDKVKKLAEKDRSEGDGKKTRYSDKTKQAAFEAVKAGATAKEVQRATGVSYPTIISWTSGARKRKRGPSARRSSTRPAGVKLIEVSPKVHASLKDLGVDFRDVTEKEVALRLLQ